MKTLEYFAEKYRLPRRRLPMVLEIQRDAREGMVPIDEVMEAFETASGAADRQLLYPYTQLMPLLRAKHPNLFTK